MGPVIADRSAIKPIALRSGLFQAEGAQVRYAVLLYSCENEIFQKYSRLNVEHEPFSILIHIRGKER